VQPSEDPSDEHAPSGRGQCTRYKLQSFSSIVDTSSRPSHRSGSDRPEVRHRLYDPNRITSEDAPHLGDNTPQTFEDFVETDILGPKVLSDAIFLACRSEEYVGFSSLQRVLGSPDTLDIGFTGTLPSYRGRGIASELKRRGVDYARTHGYRSLITGNDSLNPRIWSINQKLGFRKEEVLIQAEKTLPAPKR